jgi:hypothetical protein
MGQIPYLTEAINLFNSRCGHSFEIQTAPDRSDNQKWQRFKVQIPNRPEPSIITSK